MKISIIGAGKMGTAMANSLDGKFEIQVCEHGCSPKGEVLIFAVKPQDFEACIENLDADLSSKLIISIMAGIEIEKLQSQTKAGKVVRSLPNLPLQVGMGFTIWSTSSDLDTEDLELTKSIFQAFGDDLHVKTEEEIAKLGMLSGCGPAYFFFLCELLENAASEFGLDKEMSEKLARATFLGAAKLLENNALSASQWREAVSSKGGITLASLEKMKEDGLPEAFSNGLQAGIKRSNELNNGS